MRSPRGEAIGCPLSLVFLAGVVRIVYVANGMTSAQQQAVLCASNCEIAFDAQTRQLYATDASMYQVDPVAVAFPKTVRQLSALVDGAGQAGVSVIARGAGTGLVGGALGEGLIVDFSRYCRGISDLDRERRTVRVQPGVVLDQLNRFLRPHGFCFGPDVATSSRATLGGMIANNSSGSHTPYYGTTADHICELEVVLADSSVVRVGPKHDTLRKQRELLQDVVLFHALEIDERMPPGLLKRRPGYALNAAVKDPDNLNHLLCGSEGTLALIASAELKIVPIPARKGLGLVFFASVAEAMQATAELLNLRPAAIEHLDRVLLDQTLGQLEFQAARDLLELDFKPCQSILAVEFLEDVDDALEELSRRRFGLRTLILRSPREAAWVWEMRKAGLSLLTGMKGPAKPVTCIEDVAVRPRDLPEYVVGLTGILARAGVEACFYGHAAAGLLHVRPVLDLHKPDDLAKVRSITEEVSALARQFKASFAGEHGVGIARTEFMAEQVGETLLSVMGQIKDSFDPHNLLNPGKIVPNGRYLLDTDLRRTVWEGQLPFKPLLAFAAKDGSFLANLEQCNGCGGCRKETPVMCPTFLVTGEEGMSTRGRANIIRAALSGCPADQAHVHPFRRSDLEAVLDSCLSCKACVKECPSNVNLALLKAELLHARIRQRGLRLRERLFSSIDTLGRIGTLFPTLANAAMNSFLLRTALYKMLGLAWQRPLPNFANRRFDHWFGSRKPRRRRTRGTVFLWDDTFVRYYEPNIGVAAVKVLEAAGFEVRLVKGRACCGRPAFSQGHLHAAFRSGLRNVQAISLLPEAPILFLEPSCYSMFVDDYRELRVPGAAEIAARCFLFEQFIEGVLSDDPNALHFRTRPGKVVIHAHCHLKALMNPGFLRSLAERLPGRDVNLLDSACCGMAGAFGALEAKYELSLKVAEPLAQLVRSQPYGTAIVASGASCRHQLEHLTPLHPRHMAEVLAEAIMQETETGNLS